MLFAILNIWIIIIFVSVVSKLLVALYAEPQSILFQNSDAL